jgi:hypothetical protein
VSAYRMTKLQKRKSLLIAPAVDHCAATSAASAFCKGLQQSVWRASALMRFCFPMTAQQLSWMTQCWCEAFCLSDQAGACHVRQYLPRPCHVQSLAVAEMRL